jgi:hypothetical protein
MHIDISYVYVHNKSYASIKAKMNCNFRVEEVLINMSAAICKSLSILLETLITYLITF